MKNTYAYINTSTGEYPVFEGEVKNINNISSDASDFPVPKPYERVFDVVPPVYTENQKLIEGPPILKENELHRNFIVENLSEEELTERGDKIKGKKIEDLWHAGFNYESSSICGSAIGMLTALVLSGNAKGIAVQSWINSIWDHYYIEKAKTMADGNYNPNMDYSFIGPMPHSIPELRIELSSL